ncbi:unnamed protein product, partial [Allacma fusca]
MRPLLPTPNYPPPPMALIHFQAIHRPRATHPRQMVPNPMHPPRSVPSLMSHRLPA